ncbi:hypothetical protein [Devosia sp. 66-22]|uniref:hypothetical protein n=1 Tax=Devosia sp. 66-22 TaxID=1895753 RepID=UPI00263937C5|nr:hypothetical protein [Devosia sp. 66-22]
MFGITNSNSLMMRGNDELLDKVFPGTKRKRPLKPHESLISIEKAKEVLGYRRATIGRGTRPRRRQSRRQRN